MGNDIFYNSVLPQFWRKFLQFHGSSRTWRYRRICYCHSHLYLASKRFKKKSYDAAWVFVLSTAGQINHETSHCRFDILLLSKWATMMDVKLNGNWREFISHKIVYFSLWHFKRDIVFDIFNYVFTMYFNLFMCFNFIFNLLEKIIKFKINKN